MILSSKSPKSVVLPSDAKVILSMFSGHRGRTVFGDILRGT